MSTQRIAAIVNDEVISGYDLQQRLSLIIASSGAQPDQEAIKRIQPQILRTLVDEKLQLQEAKRQNIEVNTDEVMEAIGGIAASNNLSAEQIEQFLSQAGVNLATLHTQVYAELAWNKLVGQRFAPRVYISDEQVEDAYGRMVENANRPQYLVSEILLTVDTPEQDREVRGAAEKLIEQIRQGAPFPAVAQQFSQSASAARGGDLNWVQDGTMPPEVEAVMQRMRPGSLSAPIKTLAGYYIIVLRDRKENAGAGKDAMKSRFTVKQIAMSVSEQTTQAEGNRMMGEMEAMANKIKGCATVSNATRNMSSVVVSDIGERSGAELAPEVLNAVMPLRVGEASRPIVSRTGIHVMVLCDRKDSNVALPNRKEIQNRLFSQQLSMMSRKYLRDLRQDAVIEMR